jgi:WD40 repeat protein
VSGKGKRVFQKWLVCQKVVGKCKNEKGQRTQIVSNLAIHPSGRKIVVGTSCGSIQIWDCFGTGVKSRPLGAVYSAHGGTKPVTYVTFSCDGNRIASRSDSDDTVRIWDANFIEKDNATTNRKYGKKRGDDEVKHSPSLLLAVCKGLDALNETANCAFSPDGKFVCAGSSINPRDKSSTACGKLKFYQLPEESCASKSKEAPSNSSSNSKIAFVDPIIELGVAPNASVLGVAWHPKLNQIAFGTSNGV